MSLTPPQHRFCREYIIDRDASAACLRAYPHLKSHTVARARADRLLAKPEVEARIAELERQPPVGTRATPEWVLDRLKEEADAEGGSPSARVSALNLLMRYFGMLAADAREPDAPKFDLSKLTDVQKLAILAGLRLALGGDTRDADARIARVGSAGPGEPC